MVFGWNSSWQWVIIQMKATEQCFLAKVVLTTVVNAIVDNGLALNDFSIKADEQYCLFQYYQTEICEDDVLALTWNWQTLRGLEMEQVGPLATLIWCMFVILTLFCERNDLMRHFIFKTIKNFLVVIFFFSVLQNTLK